VILVTGATGFLGHNLCPYLVERGYRLRALVRPTSEVTFLRRLGVDLAYGDVQDAATVQRAAEGCQRIVHAAGKFRFWGRRDDFMQANLLGTHNVLQAALKARVERLVYISTLVVAGAPLPGQVLDEEVICEPRDTYQHSKLLAEQLALSYHREKGLPVTVLRPGAFYGPWGDYAFNRMFFKDPLRGLPVGVHGGKRITFPIFVPDLARVIRVALHRGRPGEIYNVAGPSLSHAQVHAIISRLAGIRPWRINPPGLLIIGLARIWTWLSRYTGREPYYSANMVPYVFCDWDTTSDKARRELDFVPTPFEDGARQTLAWYREQGLVEPVRGFGRLVQFIWRCGEGCEED
jgi:dihydroflavonol-4-reductase